MSKGKGRISRHTKRRDGPPPSAFDWYEVGNLMEVLPPEWTRREVIEKTKEPLQGVLPGVEKSVLYRKEK